MSQWKISVRHNQQETRFLLDFEHGMLVSWQQLPYVIPEGAYIQKAAWEEYLQIFRDELTAQAKDRANVADIEDFVVFLQKKFCYTFQPKFTFHECN